MITLTAPRTVTLSPQSIATILDTLAKSGPWNLMDPALKELMSQLEDKPDERIPAE
jgi:hypothetical protein